MLRVDEQEVRVDGRVRGVGPVLGLPDEEVLQDRGLLQMELEKVPASHGNGVDVPTGQYLPVAGQGSGTVVARSGQ